MILMMILKALEKGSQYIDSGHETIEEGPQQRKPAELKGILEEDRRETNKDQGKIKKLCGFLLLLLPFLGSCVLLPVS
jgi:hypothetical protein